MGAILLRALVVTLLAAADAPAPVAAEAPAAETDACLDRSIDAIQQRYEEVEDFRARFVQRTQGVHLGGVAPDPVVSRGHVVVAKPARMRWVYDPPHASVVVSDGETLWIYDPAFDEVQRLPVAEGFLSGAAVQFLLGEGDLRREFEIRAVRCGDEQAELQLVPREDASYERLHVVVDPRTGELGETRIHDLLGNVTAIAFEDLETDVDPPAETFRFEVPEGVRVIDLEPSSRAPGTGS